MELGIEPIDIHLFGMLINIVLCGEVNLLQEGVGQCLLVAGNEIHRAVRLAFHAVLAITKINSCAKDVFFIGIFY